MTALQEKDDWYEDYTKNWVKAPVGKVLKVYVINDYYIEPRVERGIIDAHGGVFIPGHGGWSSYCQSNPHYRIIPLPNPVDRGNDGWNNQCWSFDDWWEKNWQCDSWAWCYMKKEKNNEEAS